MKCKNCDTKTRLPNRYLNWREEQLCAYCAWKQYPEKYPEPRGGMDTPKFGKGKLEHGRAAGKIKRDEFG